MLPLPGPMWTRVGPQRDPEDVRDPLDLVRGEFGVHGDGEIAPEEIRRDRARLFRLVHRLQVARPGAGPAPDAPGTQVGGGPRTVDVRIQRQHVGLPGVGTVRLYVR